MKKKTGKKSRNIVLLNDLQMLAKKSVILHGLSSSVPNGVVKLYLNWKI
jgi:hypothetical protein